MFTDTVSPNPFSCSSLAGGVSGQEKGISYCLPEIVQGRLKVLVWRLLSIGFFYPDEVWQGRFEKLLKETDDFSSMGEKKYDVQLRQLQKSLATMPLESLAREYHRLFGPGGLVSLDAATYLSENPFEQAKRAADLGGFFKAFGVEAVSGNRLDSWPVLFELGSYLWIKTFHARRKKWKEKEKVTTDAIHSLVKEFLEPAFQGFLKRLEESQAGDFYLQLANLAKEVIDDKI